MVSGVEFLILYIILIVAVLSQVINAWYSFKIFGIKSVFFRSHILPFYSVHIALKNVVTLPAAALIALFPVRYLSQFEVFDGITRILLLSTLSMVVFCTLSESSSHWQRVRVELFTLRTLSRGQAILALTATLILAGMAIWARLASKEEEAIYWMYLCLVSSIMVTLSGLIIGLTRSSGSVFGDRDQRLLEVPVTRLMVVRRVLLVALTLFLSSVVISASIALSFRKSEISLSMGSLGIVVGVIAMSVTMPRAGHFWTVIASKELWAVNVKWRPSVSLIYIFLTACLAVIAIGAAEGYFQLLACILSLLVLAHLLALNSAAESKAELATADDEAFSRSVGDLGRTLASAGVLLVAIGMMPLLSPGIFGSNGVQLWAFRAGVAMLAIACVLMERIVRS